MKKLFALLLAALFTLSVCAVADTLPGDGYSIAIVYKQSGNAYFQAGVEGFMKAAEELGMEVLGHDGPEDSSNDGQERIIRNFIDQGADVIAISANDAAGLVEVCKEAREKGIIILSWDAKVDPEGRDLDIEPASAKKIGLQQLECIAEGMGYEGQLAIVSAGATAPNQNLWIQYIKEALESGVIAGYPVVDIKVKLIDGSYHEVDSSEAAFKIAGSMAIKEALRKSDPILLEPMEAVEVETPEQYMGDVMGNLSSRRGKIEGMEDRRDTKVIKAKVPLGEMFGYVTDLRSQTQGRASYTMQFDCYEAVPKAVRDEIVAKHGGLA